MELFHILEHAIQTYRERLGNNITLQRKFIIAWNSIECPVFIKPTDIQKISEVQYMLGELSQSNPIGLFQ
jgi:hypothetical protein